MEQIKINSWVVTKESMKQHIVSTPMLHVESIIQKGDKTIYSVLNPFLNEIFDYEENELIKVEAPLSELELEVLLAFRGMPSEWYEPLSQYIGELRKRLGLKELAYPFFHQKK